MKTIIKGVAWAVGGLVATVALFLIVGNVLYATQDHDVDHKIRENCARVYAAQEDRANCEVDRTVEYLQRRADRAKRASSEGIQ